MELAEKVIDNMDENILDEYDPNYFAPKAFYEALCNFNRDIVNSRHGYTLGFVRKHNNAVRIFSHEITYKRF